MKTRIIISLFIVLTIFMLWNSVAFSGNRFINYQGKLTDSSDNLINGSFNITFYIYTTQTGGSALWNETQQVTVTNSIYSVLLGEGELFPDNLFENENLYLEIQIFNPDTGTSETLSPRQELAATPYAMKSLKADFSSDADQLDGHDSSYFSPAVHNHTGGDIVSGTVSEARIDNSITRDTEVMDIVLGNDGSGSTLDADQLDGHDSSYFCPSGHIHSHYATNTDLQAIDDRVQILETGKPVFGGHLDTTAIDGTPSSPTYPFTFDLSPMGSDAEPDLVTVVASGFKKNAAGIPEMPVMIRSSVAEGPILTLRVWDADGFECKVDAPIPPPWANKRIELSFIAVRGN